MFAKFLELVFIIATPMLFSENRKSGSGTTVGGDVPEGGSCED